MEKCCGEVLARRVVEKCCREVLWRSVVEKCRGEVLYRSVVKACCREVLWGSVVGKCCEGVLWRDVAEKRGQAPSDCASGSDAFPPKSSAAARRGLMRRWGHGSARKKEMCERIFIRR